MNLCLTPAKLAGSLTMIPSKSQVHRLLICASLAKEKTEVICHASSKDIAATVRTLEALGTDILQTGAGFIVSPGGKKPSALADCGESGSTLRFLLPVAGVFGNEIKLSLSGRLPSRPLSPLWEELCAHGMELRWESENVLLCRGKLKSGTYRLSGEVSSQFISGLLFALPCLQGDSRIEILGKTESVGYIEMTLEALRQFGITILKEDGGFTVPGSQVYRGGGTKLAEGDWSNAAFWLTADALGSDVSLTGLSPSSLQRDKDICTLLSRFGARVMCTEKLVRAEGAPLSSIEIDATQIPDLVPILAVCAAAASGKTRIYGAARLRMKESDRLASVRAMLSALGGCIEETADGLLISGGRPLSGGRVDSAGDHRISMAAAIASTISTEAVYIDGAEAVEKSYPAFWEHFASLGGKTERVDFDE